MPMVTIQIFRGRADQAQKTAIAEGISAAIADNTVLEKDDVWILFQEIERSDWAVGGEFRFVTDESQA